METAFAQTGQGDETMTIQEAIKSGKPFRRKSFKYNFWYKISDVMICEIVSDHDSVFLKHSITFDGIADGVS